MTIDERKIQQTSVIQNLILENRGKLSVSGVLDVLSFDDQVIIIETEIGLLIIKGDNLRINKLSIDTSEVIVEGDISSMNYSDNKNIEKQKGSFISKIFKYNFTLRRHFYDFESRIFIFYFCIKWMFNWYYI